MHIHNNDITQGTCQNYIDPLSSKYSTFSMPIYFCGLQTLLFPIDEFHFVFYNTIIVPCSSCALSAHLTSIIAINFKLYLSNSLAAAEN